MAPTCVPLIYGAAAFGAPNTNTTRIHDLPTAQKMVDLFVSYGHARFDESRNYGLGSSEEFVGQLDLHGSIVDTKIFPAIPGAFSPENLRESLHQSLKALGPHKIRTFYLHFPDRSKESASAGDILREVNELSKAGHFAEFGLCNFFSWEVAEFVSIARTNGWIQPTVYQGRYNAIERSIELELMPCLRKWGIKFFAYSPLAGGLLVEKTLENDALNYQPGSRWDPERSTLAAWLRPRYGALFPVFREIKTSLASHNIGLAEAAHRWLQHHSALGPEDAVLIGASSLDQLEHNLKCCEGGPLPDDIVKLLDEAWEKAMPRVPWYAETAGRDGI